MRSEIVIGRLSSINAKNNSVSVCVMRNNVAMTKTIPLSKKAFDSVIKHLAVSDLVYAEFVTTPEDKHECKTVSFLKHESPLLARRKHLSSKPRVFFVLRPFVSLGKHLYQKAQNVAKKCL